MDLELNSGSVKADDIQSYSPTTTNCKMVKERHELIFEVNTICNMEKLVSDCELLSSNVSVHSISTLSERSDNFTPSNISSTGNDFKKNNFICLPGKRTLHEEEQTSVNVAGSAKGINFMTNTIQYQNCSTFDEKGDSPLRTEEIKHIEESVHNSSARTEYSDELECHHEINSDEFSDSLEDVRRTVRRHSKRKKEFDECCPICGVTVRLNDLDAHYNQEVEKLAKIPKNLKRNRHEEILKNTTFEQIKYNRENRLTARVARYTARAKTEVKCPVCSLRMSGTAEEINKHVALCIQDDDSDEMIVVDNEEEESQSFEEYEFGDETRIRPISLVPGGYRSLQGETTNRRTMDENEDLNVDVDDTFTYGEPQYSELDVIPDSTSEKDKMDLEQLRKAVLVDPSVQPNVLESRKWSTNSETKEESPDQSKYIISDPIVSSLKEKIKDLEDQNRNVKCLICLEPYSKPLVSTTCWHVHCEECWLMTMGVKKLCPQCNMIVFPSDLRKIYL